MKSGDGLKTMGALAGFLYGYGLDLGWPLPEWAKAASHVAAKCFGFNFLLELREGKPKAVGTLVGLIERMKFANNPPDTESALKSLATHVKNDLGNLPASELKDYASGHMSTENLVQKIKNPTERTLVMLAIAAGWQEVEKLGSQKKTHDWLLREKMISPNTDRAETSKWFREIGLPKGKAGRPKKIRTVQKMGKPDFSTNPKTGL